MSNPKMTDMFASSNKFVALLTYITHHKPNEIHPEWVDFIEVFPIIHNPGKDHDVASLFFDIITSDSSNANKHKKQENLDNLINLCTKDLKAQIFENLQMEPFETLSRQNKKILCFLIDKNGKVSKEVATTAKDILHALDLIEEQIFISNLVKNEEKELVKLKAPKRISEKRQADKYYFRHAVH